MRLMSDVPLGAMLSGGLDSSLIVALMAKQMDRPVQTFAVGFKEAGEGNELADARFVADDARRRPPRARALVRARRRSRSTDLVWHLDEPLADLSSLGFIALSELAAQHVTVALSGQGADELLGGYRKHRAAVARRHVAARAGAAAAGAASPAASHGPARLRRPVDTLAARRAGRAAARDERRARPAAAAASSCAARSRSSTATLRFARSRTGSATFPTRRCPRRSTSTGSSASRTTCSTTSTARRWRTRSRCACRSSTTSSSSCARRCRPR